jgi:hypothetical protein
VAAFAVAAVWLLALAASASAEVYVARSTAQLVEAVGKANANSGANKIVLTGGAYLPSTTLSITNTTGVQTIEGTGVPPVAKIEGGAVEPFPSPVITVRAGASLTLKSVLESSGGGNGVTAIDDFGTLEIASSTLAGNNGPAVSVESGASATVRNSTLSDGLDFGLIDNGSASFFNSTVTANANGGVENKNTLNLTNTIVAENKGSGDCAGKAATTSDHSLDSDGRCGVGALSKLNPLLGKLVNNGGPTPTHALQEGSPAIDAADTAMCPATDQRGVPRPDLPGTACDVGAYEFQVPREETTQKSYVAVGDSLTFGYSQELFNELFKGEPPQVFEEALPVNSGLPNGFVRDTYLKLLAKEPPERELWQTPINDGCPGETTDSAIGNGPLAAALAKFGAIGEEAPCAYHNVSGFELHHPYAKKQSQLENALEVIAKQAVGKRGRAAKRPVALVSLQIGFTDVLAAFKSCETEVETEFKEKGTSIYGNTPEAAFTGCLEAHAATFQHILRNVEAMLFAIRNGSLFGGVNYTGKIIVGGYYDPYGAVFAPGVELKPSSNALLTVLNLKEAKTAKAFGACYASPQPAFNPVLEGKPSLEPERLKAFTNMANETFAKGGNEGKNGPDVNPTPLGYEELANVNIAKCGL